MKDFIRDAAFVTMLFLAALGIMALCRCGSDYATGYVETIDSGCRPCSQSPPKGCDLVTEVCTAYQGVMCCYRVR